MTELERFTATLLTQWRADGGADGGPIGVGALLDRVLPYRVARRVLGIDISEDYEALVLRLLAEEEDLVRTEPVEASDMARATIASRLPDLSALQLLRAATVTINGRALDRLDDVPATASTRDESKWATVQPGKPDLPEVVDAPAPKRVAARTKPSNTDAEREAPARPKVVASTTEPDAPRAQRGNDIIPLHPPSAPVPPAPSNEKPPEFLTTVTFEPPVAVHCWSCSETLPPDRAVKFCPFCGADQRQPSCAACHAPVERNWKHCPDCGEKL